MTVHLIIVGVTLCFGASLFSAPISSYFNHSSEAVYVEPYRGIRRNGHNLEAVFETTILAARGSVDLAVQELRLPLIAKALATVAKKGVRVRIVLENEYSRALSELTPTEIVGLSEYDRERFEEFVRLVDVNEDGLMSPDEISDRDSLVILRNAGVNWIDDRSDGSAGSGLMHHKFMVVDRQTVVVSSANLTMSDIHGDFKHPESRGNANSVIAIESPEMANVFSEEFEILWSKKFGLKKRFRRPRRVVVAGTPITVQFSPTSKTLGYEASVNGLIGRMVGGAKRSVDMGLFVFSEQAISDSLERAYLAGASVRLLIDHSFAYRNYSELLDVLGLKMLDAKCRYETGNRPWQPGVLTAGSPWLPDGDKLHHKMAVIDSEAVLFGSHNWSNAANRENDETLLVLESAGLAQSYTAEFDQLFRSASMGHSPWLIDKIAAIEKKCGVTKFKR